MRQFSTAGPWRYRISGDNVDCVRKSVDVNCGVAPVGSVLTKHRCSGYVYECVGA